MVTGIDHLFVVQSYTDNADIFYENNESAYTWYLDQQSNPVYVINQYWKEYDENDLMTRFLDNIKYLKDANYVIFVPGWKKDSLAELFHYIVTFFKIPHDHPSYFSR